MTKNEKKLVMELLKASSAILDYDLDEKKTWRDINDLHNNLWKAIHNLKRDTHLFLEIKNESS